MLAPASDTNSKAKAAIGLKTAVKILDRWGATIDQGEAILRVSHSTYAKAKKAESLEEVALDRDQLARISYLLNIHDALRRLFELLRLHENGEPQPVLQWSRPP